MLAIIDLSSFNCVFKLKSRLISADMKVTFHSAIFENLVRSLLEDQMIPTKKSVIR